MNVQLRVAKAVGHTAAIVDKFSAQDLPVKLIGPLPARDMNNAMVKFCGKAHMYLLAKIPKSFGS